MHSSFGVKLTISEVNDLHNETHTLQQYIAEMYLVSTNRCWIYTVKMLC